MPLCGNYERICAAKINSGLKVQDLILQLMQQDY